MRSGSGVLVCASCSCFKWCETHDVHRVAMVPNPRMTCFLRLRNCARERQVTSLILVFNPYWFANFVGVVGTALGIYGSLKERRDMIFTVRACGRGERTLLRACPDRQLPPLLACAFTFLHACST